MAPIPVIRYSPLSKCFFYKVVTGASSGRSVTPVKNSIFQSGLPLLPGALASWIYKDVYIFQLNTKNRKQFKILRQQKATNTLAKQNIKKCNIFCVFLKLDIYTMNLIQNYSKEIINLCKIHKVKSLYAFGSVLTDKFNSESDVDLVVDFQPIDVLDYGDNYYNLKFSLEDIFKRNVDLLEEKALRNPYFIKTLNKNKKLIYG
ncbi:nucleotidyltransferase domain-containing protein [Flavobacterium ovatum]|uniref:nucleotidyltransferase family protein n=1 Tax=Flavobacterium ovatum TaxID=1928857 RepID=UPI0034501683